MRHGYYEKVNQNAAKGAVRIDIVYEHVAPPVRAAGVRHIEEGAVGGDREPARLVQSSRGILGAFESSCSGF